MLTGDMTIDSILYRKLCSGIVNSNGYILREDEFLARDGFVCVTHEANQGGVRLDLKEIC